MLYLSIEFKHIWVWAYHETPTNKGKGTEWRNKHLIIMLLVGNFSYSIKCTWMVAYAVIACVCQYVSVENVVEPIWKTKMRMAKCKIDDNSVAFNIFLSLTRI